MQGRLKRKDWFAQAGESADRVENDILITGKENFWIAGNEPFMASATTAIFLTRGTAEVTINMVEYKVKAPSMIIYMDGMIVRQGALSDGARMDVILLSEEFTDDILSESNVYGRLRARIMKTPVFPLQGQEKVTIAFNYLLISIVRMKDSPYRLEAVRHMALLLFYGFALQEPDASASKKASRSDAITERFFERVREHYKTEREVAYYASELCITPKYLSQAVKDATGKPALDWIEDFVIAEAKALLRSTDHSIEKIAEELGFTSQSLFGKYFKRVAGMSPRAYRTASR